MLLSAVVLVAASPTFALSYFSFSLWGSTSHSDIVRRGCLPTGPGAVNESAVSYGEILDGFFQVLTPIRSSSMSVDPIQTMA